ncbi:N/A [soil metagenome]
MLIAGCAVLGAGAAAFVTWNMEPQYRATASLRIDSKPTQLPTLTTMGLTASNPLHTEIEILNSQSLAERVADSLGISAGVVRSNTSVYQRTRDADIVDVSVTSSSPEMARDIANALVTEFIDGRHDARRAEAEAAAVFLREQSNRVASELASAESELQGFREREGIVSLESQAASGVARRAELEAQRNALEAERSALQSLLSRAGRESGRTGAAAYRELLAFPPLLRSSAAGLIPPLMAAEERVNDLLARRTREDPDVQLAEARIGELQREIQTTVRTYLQGLGSQVQALSGILAQSGAQLAGVPARETRYAQLDRSAKNTEMIYSMLQQRLQEAEIAAASTDQSVRLVDAAIAPGSPEKPKPILYLALGTLAGAMLGLGGALFVQRNDKSLHTRREVLAATSLPVLGLIPHVGASGRWHLGSWRTPERPLHLRVSERASAQPARLRSGGTTTPVKPKVVPSVNGDAENGFPEDQMMAFREAYVWLATNLRLTLGQHPVKSILITSALPGEGKTTIAINLAMSLAQEGQRVLLVDADLRAGRIAQSLGINSGKGLTDVLAGRVEAERAVANVDLGGGQTLNVLPGNGPVPRPTQMLSSRRYRDLIEWAKASHDAVIIDATPVNNVADAAVLARNADGVLFVARSGVSEYPAIAFAMEQLRASGATVLGAVLNDADLRRDAELGHAYEYYGRYAAATAST